MQKILSLNSLYIDITIPNLINKVAVVNTIKATITIAIFLAAT